MTEYTSDNDSTERNDSTKNKKIRKPLGRPRTNPSRWNPDGSLSSEYINAYFKEHYHKPHICEYCGKERKCSDNIIRHQKSARCVEARKQLGLILPFPLL